MNSASSASVISFRKALLCSASVATLFALELASAQPALAQDQGAAATQEIVVTGSRIVRRDFSAASPIVTVNSSDLKQSESIGIEQSLNKLPQFVPGSNQFAGATDAQATATNTPGTATLNQRGLGVNRNLVLIDGRRAQPFNASLAIDLNTIPAAAIDNVEVITGGAAAVYGADAIAGVVNFKLRKDFQGVEVDGQWGQTEVGDGTEIQGSMLVGANVDDGRGNVMVGLNYAKRDAVMQADRPFFTQAWSDPLAPGYGSYIPVYSYIGRTLGAKYNGSYFFNIPSYAAVQCVFAGVGAGCPFTGVPNGNLVAGTGVTVASLPNSISNGPGGLVYRSGGDYFGFNSDNTLFVPTIANNAVASSPGGVGYKGPLYPDMKITAVPGLYKVVRNNTFAQASLPLQRYSFFANGHYDINDSVTAYVQGTFTNTSTDTLVDYNGATVAWEAPVPYNSDPNTIDTATLTNDGTAANNNKTLPQYVALGCAPVGGCTYGQSHAVPAQLAYLLNSRAVNPLVPNTGPNSTWDLTGLLPWMGPRHFVNDTNTYQILAGFKGKLPEIGFLKDWTFDAYAAHGNTSILTHYINYLNDASYKALIAAPFFGAGYTYTWTFTGQQAKCTTGLPVFSQFKPSQDCLDIITANMHSVTTLEQNLAEVDIQGALFNLPAGEVRAAIGGDYRLDAMNYDPDDEIKASNPLTSGNILAVSPAKGQVSVTEAYGELLVPVLKDLPFVKSFGLELGGRGSSYNRASGAMIGTFKVLGNWAVNDWLSFRGGWQHADRAPNVAELFAPPSSITTQLPFLDPCTNVTRATWGNNPVNPNRAQVQALCTQLAHGFIIDSSYVGLGSGGTIAVDTVTGNPKLQNESAVSWTAGSVIRSPWQTPLLSRFQASIDWYSIKIADAITQSTSALLYEQCLNAFGGNSTYSITNPSCQLLRRGSATGYPEGANALYINTGGLRTSGVDVQIDWGADLADFMETLPGSVSVSFVASKLFGFEVEEVGGGPWKDYAGTTGSTGTSGSQYQFKTFTTVGYSIGPANISVNWRHLPQIKNIVAGALPTPAYDMVGLTGGWNFGKNLSLRAGIDNLFDVDPPRVGVIPGVNSGAGNTDRSVYDIIGRRFFVGFTAKM